MLFLFAVVTAVVRVGRALLTGARGDGWRAARRAIVATAALAALVAFDVGTLDVFNVAKLAIVVLGALSIVVSWAAEWAWTGRWPLRRAPLMLPVGAVVVAACITTATSTNVRISILGFYGSYDGLVLVLACAVLFLGVGDSFDAEHLRPALLGLFGIGGGLVALYALFQTHDRVFDGASPWDWVTWGKASFQRTGAIWSTLGNPNHLAGLVAMLLPIGVVLVLGSRSRRERVLVGVLEAVLLVELVQTTTRGAWIAAAVSLPVLAVLLLGEVRRHRRAAAMVVGSFVAFALLSLAVVVATPSLNARYRELLEVGGKDSLTARVELSKSAVRIGAARPLVGTGPDLFRVAFQWHQTPRFVAVFGPRRIANGAHNMFLNQFATQGMVGLAALAWLVIAAFWRGLRALRGTDGDARLVGAGLVAALVAFVVQSSFNVQQVALTTLFWALLGLVSVYARDAAPVVTSPSGVSRPNVVRALVGGAITLACVAVAVVAVRPWTADDSALRAARVAADGSFLDAREHARAAASGNPWEARYVAAEAELSTRAADRAPGNPEPRLREAVRAYRRLMEIQPADAAFLHDYSEVLLALGRRDAARYVLSRAVEANPHDPLLKEKLDALR